LVRFVLALGLMGLAGAICGCGDSFQLVPVTGKVTVGGKPLASGMVSYRPDRKAGNKFGGEPLGEIKNGVYTLETRGKPGAPVGKYRVVVAPSGPPDNTKPTVKAEFDPKYSLAEKSGLDIEVVPNAPAGKYDLKLD
jgi:hypothetical protein